MTECMIHTNQKTKQNKTTSFVASQWLLLLRNDLDYIKDTVRPSK